jgi:hypothetical protein
MQVVAEIYIDIIKLDSLKQKLSAIASTIDGFAPQKNKNRRIKNLLKMAEKAVEEMVVVKHKEVSDG